MSDGPLTDESRARVCDLFDGHRRLIEQVAASRVAPDDVPDVVQDVGLRLCRATAVPCDPVRVRQWLIGMAVKVTADLHRERRRERSKGARLLASLSPDEPTTLGDPVAERLDAETRRVALRAAIGRLRPFDRTETCHTLLSQDDFRCRSDARRTRHRRIRARLRVLLDRDPRVT